MLDLRGQGERWDLNLKPFTDENGVRTEPFDGWWSRCSAAMPGLHPQGAEQWVHRHWYYSPYCDLPLSLLSSRLERWTTERILAEVAGDDVLSPDHDYRALRDLHTGRTMLARGTWDYPLLVIATPDGYVDWSGERPNGRHHLIEGHLRLRFLNALAARGEARGEHELIILEVAAPASPGVRS